jgi:hypothetical protein
MSFDKEKIKTAINAINGACLHCGSSHTNECAVNMAKQALKSVE